MLHYQNLCRESGFIMSVIGTASIEKHSLRTGAGMQTINSVAFHTVMIWITVSVVSRWVKRRFGLFFLDGAPSSHSKTVGTCRVRQSSWSAGEQECAKWICVQHPVYRWVVNHLWVAASAVNGAHVLWELISVGSSRVSTLLWAEWLINYVNYSRW